MLGLCRCCCCRLLLTRASCSRASVSQSSQRSQLLVVTEQTTQPSLKSQQQQQQLLQHISTLSVDHHLTHIHSHTHTHSHYHHIAPPHPLTICSSRPPVSPPYAERQCNKRLSSVPCVLYFDGGYTPLTLSPVSSLPTICSRLTLRVHQPLRDHLRCAENELCQCCRPSTAQPAARHSPLPHLRPDASPCSLPSLSHLRPNATRSATCFNCHYDLVNLVFLLVPQLTSLSHLRPSPASRSSARQPREQLSVHDRSHVRLHRL